MGTIEKYATKLEQHQDARFQTNEWKNLENGVGNTGVATTSEYTENFVPQQLYAHAFDVQLPDIYRIQSLTFEVKLRGAVKNTQVPRAYFDLNSVYGHNLSGADYGSNVFSTQPNTNLSDSFNVVRYTMDWSEVVQYGATKSNIESDKFGVILQFNNSSDAGGVAVEWVRVVVDILEERYNCEVTANKSISTTSYMAKATCVYTSGSLITVNFKVISTETRLPTQPQSVLIDIPMGMRIVDYTATGGTFDSNTRIFHCDFDDGTGRNVTGVSGYVSIRLRCTTLGLKKFGIKGSGKVPSSYRYIYVERGDMS